MTANRLTSLAGIVFAVLFVASVIMLSSIPVGGDASTDEEIRKFYGDSGDRLVVIIGLYLAGLAAISFIIFLAGLYRAWRSESAGVEPILSLAMLLAGIAFVSAYLAGAALLASISGAISLGGEPDELPDTGVARFLGQAGYASMILVGAMLAGAFTVLASILILRTNSLPAWTGWAGVIVGIIVATIGVIFIPMALFPLWILVISILMLRGSTAA